ncbi:MAG TPA: hypothetical protein PLW65_03620 [Pseudomonadota bacterium]|nr:hypothetical protein [Pseudomonadota bacterium]
MVVKVISALVMSMSIGACPPCHAQSALAAECALPASQIQARPPPAPERGETRTESTTAAQRQSQHAEVLRLWNDFCAQIRSGDTETVRAAYILYLQTYYEAYPRPELLLELGRRQEQRGQRGQALVAYKRYLLAAPEQREDRAGRKEAWQAIVRLTSEDGSGIIAGAILLPAGLLTLGVGLKFYVELQPNRTICNELGCYSSTAVNSREQLPIAAVVSVAGGVITLLGSAYLIQGLRKPAPHAASGLAAVYVAPYLGPDAAALLVAGRF